MSRKKWVGIISQVLRKIFLVSNLQCKSPRSVTKVRKSEPDNQTTLQGGVQMPKSQLSARRIARKCREKFAQLIVRYLTAQPIGGSRGRTAVASVLARMWGKGYKVLPIAPVGFNPTSERTEVLSARVVRLPLQTEVGGGRKVFECVRANCRSTEVFWNNR